MARADILRMLLINGYGPLPSLADLQYADRARRLRDALIEDDKMDMAMEVLWEELKNF